MPTKLENTGGATAYQTGRHISIIIALIIVVVIGSILLSAALVELAVKDQQERSFISCVNANLHKNWTFTDQDRDAAFNSSMNACKYIYDVPPQPGERSYGER